MGFTHKNEVSDAIGFGYIADLEVDIIVAGLQKPAVEGRMLGGRM